MPAPFVKTMRNSLILVAIVAIAGCSGNGPAHGEDVTATIKAMPAEQRFELIKKAGGMSPQMKVKAIDELPATDEQKAAWKKEIAGT